MVETTLPGGLETSGQRVYCNFWHISRGFKVFPFKKKNGFLGILGPLHCGIGATIRIGRVFLPPIPEVGCPIFLEIRNPWGKVMERSGLTFKHFCLEVV